MSTERHYDLTVYAVVEGFGDDRAMRETARVAARALRNAFGDGVTVMLSDGTRVDPDERRDVPAELADVPLPRDIGKPVGFVRETARGSMWRDTRPVCSCRTRNSDPDSGMMHEDGCPMSGHVRPLIERLGIPTGTDDPALLALGAKPLDEPDRLDWKADE